MAEQDNVLHAINEIMATMNGETGTPQGEPMQDVQPRASKRHYKPTDIIEPEGFFRAIIDRSITKADSYFGQAFGWENSILPTSISRLVALGRISLLDIGCGTGNTLRTWMAALREYVEDPENVTGTGVNLHDYSKESQSPLTRDAITLGDITYVVGNAESMHAMPEVPDESADIVVACMSLIHMRRPTLVTNRIERALRPGGVAFINVPDDLGLSGSPLMARVCAWEDEGYEIDMRTGIVSGSNPDDSWSTLFMRIQKPESA